MHELLYVRVAHTNNVNIIDCRPHTSDWISLGGQHQLSDEVTLMNPPAVMVDEQKEVIYQSEGRDYKVRYAGKYYMVDG